MDYSERSKDCGLRTTCMYKGTCCRDMGTPSRGLKTVCRGLETRCRDMGYIAEVQGLTAKTSFRGVETRFGDMGMTCRGLRRSHTGAGDMVEVSGPGQWLQTSVDRLWTPRDK